MSVEDDILSRVKAAEIWDKDSSPEHFQIRAHENGFVLVNLKTGRAYLLYDEYSHLHDWKDLFPNLVILSSQKARQRS